MNVKASDVVVIRKMVQERDPQAMKSMQAALTSAKECFPIVSATEWIRLEQESDILQAAARVLYPADPQALQRLGCAVAGIVFNGIYKVFLRVASVDFIIKRLSAIWRTLYDQGEARIENMTSNSGTLVATNMPDLSLVQRQYICGYLTGVLQLAGVKNVQVTHVSADSKAWQWMFRWE